MYMADSSVNHDQQKNIKGIVFDKDGTLFDFNSVWSVWCDRVLHDLSYGDVALGNRLAGLIGYDAINKVFTSGSLIVSAAADDTASALADAIPGASLEEVNAVCIRHLGQLPVIPINGLVTFLEELDAEGLTLGVATNDLESSAISQLAQAGISRYFDFICGCDSGFGSKPAPGMIHAFCDATGLAASEVVMVGDSLHDINAGKAAGSAFNVGVLTGPATELELMSEADAVLPDATALKTLL